MSIVQSTFGVVKPSFCLSAAFAKSSVGDSHQVGTGVKEVNNLKRVRKVFVNDAPNPDGSIGNENQLFGVGSPPRKGACPDQITEGFQSLGL